MKFRFVETHAQLCTTQLICSVIFIKLLHKNLTLTLAFQNHYKLDNATFYFACDQFDSMDMEINANDFPVRSFSL